MTLRHNELRGNVNKILQEVINAVRIELILQSLNEAELSISGNTSMEACADMS